MAKAEDLEGKVFGFLKAIDRAPDRTTKSGQKKVCWSCQCLLCGNLKSVPAGDLKAGKIKSCGCYQASKGRRIRAKRKCIICGKQFDCPPSGTTVTCSYKCRVKYASNRAMGHKAAKETREKISAAAKGRDLSQLQPAAVEAAKSSPNSGRFETNVNAVDWHLISPDGKHYYFRSLNFWLRENGLFGCEPDSREFNNVRSGLSGAKRAMLGKTYGSTTYKGWRVIPTESDNRDFTT